MKSIKSSDKKTQMFKSVGDIGLVLLLVSTCAISFCMLKKWPSKDMFDNNWLSNGFCISNQDTRWWNSHTLSFYADTLFALLLWYLYEIRKSANDAANIPPIQKALLSGSITGVFGHGIGHLSLGMGTLGTDFRFNPTKLINSIACQIVFIVPLGAIFKGTMPLASNKTLLITAMISSIGFTVLDIEPSLNFVYVQGVIYIASALSMLSLPAKEKDAAIYAVFPLIQFPVLMVGIMESLGCEFILEPIGGHVIYDSMIAVMTIFGDIVSTRLEQSRAKDINKKSI